MIEIVMYVALGFLLAWLIALVLAPQLWRRAVRLTTRRLEATMPMSPKEIEADKDELRAQFAVQVRRVEIALAKAKESAARNLVERSKRQARIDAMKVDIERLQTALNERSNELNVLEQTVKRKFPELEGELEQAKETIAAREGELFRLSTAFTNQSEALASAKDVARQRQDEIEQLRRVLEGDQSAMAVLRLRKTQTPAEDEQRLAEDNQRLTAEVSRLREEIAQLKSVATQENDLLKLEMKRLADRIMRAASDRKTAAEAQALEAQAEQAQREAAAALNLDNNVTPLKPEEPRRARRLARRARRKAAAEGSLAQRLESLVNSES